MAENDPTRPITDPDEFKREELDDLARAEGIPDPDKMPNKGAVVAAINDSRAAKRANGGAPEGSNPPRDDRESGATGAGRETTVGTTSKPTADAVFGEVQEGTALAYDTSAYQPEGDEPPIYGDARTRTLVDPHGRRVDGAGSVNKADDNRDRGNV